MLRIGVRTFSSKSISCHFTPLNSPRRRPVPKSSNTISLSRAGSASGSARNCFTSSRVGVPRRFPTLTNLADGIALRELVADCMLIKKMHNVTNLLFAARRQIQLGEPVLTSTAFTSVSKREPQGWNNPVRRVFRNRLAGGEGASAASFSSSAEPTAPRFLDFPSVPASGARLPSTPRLQT